MKFEVHINVSAFNASVTRQAKPIMEQDLKEITQIIAEQAERPKSGRIYRGSRNRASAPGESPARQTGALIESITRPRVFRSGNQLVGEIRIRAPYAIKLQRGIGIARRPIAEPAVEEFLRRQGR